MDAHYLDKHKSLMYIIRSRFAPYWPVFILFLVFSFALGYAYVYFKTPEYQARASILIKDEKKGIDDSPLIESFNFLSSKKIVENEIEVLKSRTLIKEVVVSLGLYAPVEETDGVKSRSAYSSSPVRIESAEPDQLRECKNVAFNFDPGKKTVNIAGAVYPVSQWVTTSQGKLRFLVNDSSWSPSKSKLSFSLISPRSVVTDLADAIGISPTSKLSTVLNIKLNDEVPKRAEDILNSLIVAYSKASVKDKNRLADSTLTFIDERLKSVTSDLNSIEKKLAVYRSNKNAVDISSQGKMFLQNVSENDQRMSQVSMQLAVLDEVEKSVQSDGQEDISPSTIIIDDPSLSRRLEELSQVQLQYDKLRKTAGENNTLVVSLTDQINRIKRGILESVKNQRKSLEAGKTNLAQTNDQYNSLLQTVPQKERDLIEINRQQSLKSNLYNFLSQKKEETALSHSSLILDSRIVDRAESTMNPVNPDKRIVIGACIILALLLFAIWILFKEILNNKVLYRREIEELTQVPVISEIPYHKSKTPIVVDSDSSTYIAEQFRKLRTSLGYLDKNKSNKKILITSVVSGEGKSFIAANLGMSLALAGNKVLLMEFDFVNPSLSQKFDIDAEQGLIAYLNDKAEAEEIILNTALSDSLFIMPAGDLVNVSSDLLQGKKVEELLDYMEKIFDFVIIDAAPLGLKSDAYILSKHADATLYVIRHNVTPKSSVERIDDNNKINQFRNMAIIFNSIRRKGFGKSGSTYGYDKNYKQVKRKQIKRTRSLK